jgi:hypothetical protein
MRSQAWLVTSKQGWRHDRNGKIVRLHSDIVFYDADCDADYVRSSLIDHDGYPDDIRIGRKK